jgi:3,4-dihydroxy 2-butanone 4-phosphate synthase/GTP cyclohydrolase II
LKGYGLEIVDQLPIRITPNSENEHYLRTKQAKMGHTLGLPETPTHQPADVAPVE